ncbi:MAG TPA: HmuY family protein [Aquaticitalea sp.]|nr:HmuY family protein [Aquaticitalea sp.]
MKTIKFLTLAFLLIGFTSCSSDDDSGTPSQASEFETETNLYAPQTGGQGTGEDPSGEFIKFSFSSGAITTSETEWDIAFRGTTILVNGGEETLEGQPVRTGNGGGYIATGTFADLATVDITAFNEDSSTDGLAIQDWYTYDGQRHMINPTPGKILVIRTHDNKYAKMEITSYYENETPNAEIAPTNFQYYTFNYVYQANEGVTTF